MGGMGMPTEKAMDFTGSLRRLRRAPARRAAARRRRDGRSASCSVTLAVLGPKLLGNATNVIFAGVIGRQLPAGATQAEAVEGLRAQGQRPARRPRLAA